MSFLNLEIQQRKVSLQKGYPPARRKNEQEEQYGAEATICRMAMVPHLYADGIELPKDGFDRQRLSQTDQNLRAVHHKAKRLKRGKNGG